MYFFHMSWLIVFCHRHYTRCWVGVIIGLQDDEEDDFDPEDEFDPKTLGEKKAWAMKKGPWLFLPWVRARDQGPETLLFRVNRGWNPTQLFGDNFIKFINS